jgi:hypothetical protein
VTITQADGRRILQRHFKKHVPQATEAQEHTANRDRSQ